MPASKQHPTDKHTPSENHAYAHDVHTFLEWHAPGRPFIKHSFDYFRNVFLIMLALEIILFLFSQYLLMLVVLALVFLSVALAAIPPHEFYYKVTSEGIRVEDYFFLWGELYDFFFMPHHGQQTLHITTKSYIPGELMITLGDVSEDEVKRSLLPYLPYREYVKPTFMEKSGEWLAKNFPLEKTT